MWMWFRRAATPPNPPSPPARRDGRRAHCDDCEFCFFNHAATLPFDQIDECQCASQRTDAARRRSADDDA